MSQGIQWPLEAKKGKEMGSPSLEPPERNNPADTLILAL